MHISDPSTEEYRAVTSDGYGGIITEEVGVAALGPVPAGIYALVEGLHCRDHQSSICTIYCKVAVER